MDEEYKKLRAGWIVGERGREGALRLLFLSWMHWADPPGVTGMDDDPEAANLWHAIFAHFDGEASSDPEFLYIASIMAVVAGWGLGDEDEWSAAAERLRTRLLQIRPEGFTPDAFKGRGEYGRYFAHQATSRPRGE